MISNSVVSAAGTYLFADGADGVMANGSSALPRLYDPTLGFLDIPGKTLKVKLELTAQFNNVASLGVVSHDRSPIIWCIPLPRQRRLRSAEVD